MRKLLIALLIWSGVWLPQLSAQNIVLDIVNTTVTKGNVAIVEVSTQAQLTGISAFQLNFAFDPNIVSFVGVELEGTLMEAFASPTTNVSPNNIARIAWASASNLEGTGIILKLKFMAIQPGASYIHLNGLGNFFNEGNPTATSNYGLVSVNDLPQFWFYPENVKLLIGESIEIATYGGTAPYTFYLTNPNVGSVDVNGRFTAETRGKTRVVATDANSVTDSTNGFFEVASLRIGIRDTTSFPNQTKMLPVNFENTDGTEVEAGQFKIDFFDYIFSEVTVVTEGTLLTNANLSYHWENQKLSISFASSTPLVNSGVLCYLEVKAKTQSAAQYLNITDALFNEDIQPLVLNGLYYISPFAYIQVTGGGLEMVANETSQFNASGGREPYLWSSSHPSILSVNSFGQATALSGGQAQVIVTDADGATGSSEPITIKDLVVSVVDTSAVEISAILLPIRITTPPAGKGLDAFQGKLLYDDEKLIFNEIVTAGSLSSAWTVVGNSLGQGMVSFAGSGVEQIVDAGDLFYASFTLTYNLPKGYNTQISLSELIFNEGSPNYRLESGTLLAYSDCETHPEVSIVSNGDLNICEGENFELILSATENANYNYAWFKDGVEIDGANQSTFNVAEAGIYKVKANTSASCFSFSNELIASVNAYPSAFITFDNDTVICVGETKTLYANSDNASAYQWLKDGFEIPFEEYFYINVGAEGSYQVRISSPQGCTTVSEAVHIDYGFDLGITAQSATEFCEGGSVILETDLLDAESYQWYKDDQAITGQTSTSLLVTESGNYNIIAQKEACSAASNSISVIVYGFSVIDLGPDLSLCENTGLTQLSAFPSGGYWTGPATDSTGQFDPALAGVGEFTLIYTVGNEGCISSDSLSVSVGAEVVIITSPDTTVFYNEGNVTLSTNTSGGFWSGIGVSTDGIFNSLDAGIGTFELVYSLTIGNCTGADTTLVAVEKGRQLIITNAIDNRTILDNYFSIAATGGASGEPLEFTALTANIEMIGNQVSMLGSGLVQIQVSQGGNDFYNAAENVLIEFSIEKLNQIVSVSAIEDKVYGDADFYILASSSNPNQPLVYTALTSNISLNQNLVSIIGTGDAMILISQAGSEFYTESPNDTLHFFIDKINQTISSDSINDKVYGDPSFIISANGGASNLPLVYTALSTNITLEDNLVNIVGVGLATIRVSQTGNEYYHPAPHLDVNFNILKANQEIIFEHIMNKTYGDESFALQATGSNSGIPITFVSLMANIAISGNMATILGAGPASIRAFQVGNEFYNEAAFVERSFIINKANQSITFSPISDKLDGDPSFELGAMSSTGLSISYNIVQGNVSVNGSVLNILGPGRVIVEALQFGNDNYNPAPSVSQSFCVIPVPQFTVSNESILTSNYSTGNQWMLDGVDIPNANDNVFTATESGTYSLKVRVDDCEAISAESITLAFLGLKSTEETELFIYPNPSSGKVNVAMSKKDFSQAHSIKLIDLNGRTLEVAITENEHGYSVDLSKLKAGMYIIQVQGSGFIYQSRIIKN